MKLNILSLAVAVGAVYNSGPAGRNRPGPAVASVPRVHEGSPTLHSWVSRGAEPNLAVISQGFLKALLLIFLSIFIALRAKQCRRVMPQKAGEYEFACQMGMFRGKLIVE